MQRSKALSKAEMMITSHVRETMELKVAPASCIGQQMEAWLLLLVVRVTKRTIFLWRSSRTVFSSRIGNLTILERELTFRMDLSLNEAHLVYTSLPSSIDIDFSRILGNSLGSCPAPFYDDLGFLPAL